MEPAIGYAVATGKVDITPRPGIVLAGYGLDAPRIAAGTCSPLTVRCTVLWVAGTACVLVTADLLGFPRPLHQRIRAAVVRLGVRSEDFVLTAMHTHNGPVVNADVTAYTLYNITSADQLERIAADVGGEAVMTVTATVIVGATSLFSFLSLLATLVFLWKVYQHGGRNDLTAAARALHEARRHQPLARERQRTGDQLH
ncbi:hypothetical protein [Amycolatopsis vastitatis]|uniref:Neutral/alkaline non-lysosomal ceramidase N-terminal domain-containing protein n=1 Tax=Amycolatopsis vastitatis TaxID=1905142 RepID=A0A229SM62_9PSEU|nr:hypothetical protein [Amycolatopsis vastitatis]OXM59761.1 hypothetical protein CF165_46000 [Amycolatopsis vastitatis]